MTEQHPTPSPPEWSSIELPELSLRVIEQGWTEVTLASDPIADELEGVND